MFILILLLHSFYPDNIFFWILPILFVIILLIEEIKAIKHGERAYYSLISCLNFTLVFLVIGNSFNFFYNEDQN